MKLISLKHVGKKRVYDIEVRDHHNFVANNVVVHNCTSAGAQRLFKKAKPKSIIDIAMLTSIYRPGPLAANVDKLYLKSKNDGEEYDWGDKRINELLKDTYGCLAEGTLVKTSEGEVPIENIVDECQVGLKLLTYNEQTGQVEQDEVVAVADNGVKDLLEIETTTGTLRLTPDHKVLTSLGWKRADELTLVDCVVSVVK